MTVMVMGASGNVGAQVVTALRERGVPVRAVSRRERPWPDGVDGFVGDPNVEHDLDEALDGVDGVFMMSGYAAEVGLLEARSTAHVVLLSASEGQAYRLSGPAALTPADQVASLGAALGRELVLEPMTDDEAREQTGAPYGDALVRIFRDHPELETEVQPTVERLLGRPPGSLPDWLARHRGPFDTEA